MAAFAPAVAPIPLKFTAREIVPVWITLTTLAISPTKPDCLMHNQIHISQTQGIQRCQSNLGIELQQVRLETALGQTALHGHLTTFKANLVVAARTRFLPLVAAASGLSQTRSQYHDPRDAWRAWHLRPA